MRSMRMPAKYFFFFLFVILTAASAYADGAPDAWEEKYKDEPYIVLLSDQVVNVDKDCSATTVVHMVKKVQSEGSKDLGEIPIRYDKKFEQISGIEAYTTSPDGKKTKAETVQDLSTSGEDSIYSDDRVKMITMPGVVVGSVIDVKFTFRRVKPVIENNFYDEFVFSSDCPIKQASYRLTVPSDMPLKMKVYNAAIEPKVEKDGDKVTYTWRVTNSDKEEMEEYMPSAEEVYKSLSVSTLKDWRQLSDWDWGLFKKNLTASTELKKKVAEITAGKASVEEKVQAVIEYIRGDFRYVGMNIESHNFEPHPAGEIFKNRYGDCKDQTLLAMAMLSEIGINARPVLLATYSDLGREDLLPTPNCFNHAILSFELSGKQYYTDVLYKGYRFQDIPAAYDGKRVFVVDDKGGSFTVLPFSDQDETANRTEECVTIKDGGDCVIEDKLTLSRSSSVGLRESLKEVSAHDKEKFFSMIETRILSGGKLLDKGWTNVDSPYTLISGTVRYESTSFVQRMGDMMMFGLSQASRSSIFTAPKRVNPIVFRSTSLNVSSVKYVLPPGYEVMVLPKKVFLDTPFASYLREYVAGEGGLVTAKEQLQYKRNRVPAAGYQGVQNFFDEIARATNEKILIKKRSM